MELDYASAKGIIEQSRQLKADHDKMRRELGQRPAGYIYTNDLVQLAMKACLYPGALSDVDLKSVAWFPQSGFLTAFVDNDGILSPCARDVLGRMVHLNDGGDYLLLDWVKTNAAQASSLGTMPPPRVMVDLNLVLLAQAVCRDPDQLSPSQMAFYLNGFPDGQKMTMDGPKDCFKDLFDELMGFNMSWRPGANLSWHWLIERAKALRQQYSPPAPDPSYPGSGAPVYGGPGYNHCIDPGRTCMSR